MDLGGPYGQFYLLSLYYVVHQCKHNIVDTSTHAFWVYGHMYIIGTKNTYIRSEQHASSPQSFLLWNLFTTVWLWGLYWASQHSIHRCTSSGYGPYTQTLTTRITLIFTSCWLCELHPSLLLPTSMSPVGPIGQTACLGLCSGLKDLVWGARWS